jgi:transcriptional regulator with XRE-family HTH domain
LIYTNISNLCKARGISIAKLEKEMGFGNATIRGWVTSSPTVEKLKAVADYFSVTVDELLSDQGA